MEGKGVLSYNSGESDRVLMLVEKEKNLFLYLLLYLYSASLPKVANNQ